MDGVFNEATMISECVDDELKPRGILDVARIEMMMPAGVHPSEV